MRLAELFFSKMRRAGGHRPGRQRAKALPRKLLFETLESRLLLSADPVVPPLAALLHPDPPPAHVDLPEVATADVRPTLPPQASDRARERAGGQVNAAIKHNVLTISGTVRDDQIVLRLKAGDSSLLEIDVDDDGSADFTFNRNRFEEIVVAAGAGDDLIRIDEANGVFTDTEKTTLDGEGGNDTLRGGSGAETLLGGDGNDTIDGNRGNDTAFMGAGDDTFIWDPGDGSDVVEGQAGTDTLLFNGAGASENIDISANGSRTRFFRDIGNITMDMDDVERIQFNAFGGADTTTVHNLAGTDVTDVIVDVTGTPIPVTGDGQVDRVIVEGTGGADTIQVTASGGQAHVTGLAAAVHVVHAEPGIDQLVVNGLGGDDTITGDPAVGALLVALVDGGAGNDTVITNGTGGNDTFQVTASGTNVRVANGAGAFFEVTGTETLQVNGLGGDDTLGAGNGLATLIALQLDGGDGNDIINGGDGADVLRGGDGNDTIDGNRGNDTAFMGAGDDTFIWDPGDGSDVVEGQAGTDTLLFNGANIAEKIDISANGTRSRFTRDIASITMDMDDVERIQFNALGGADTITVNDLTGTDVTQVTVDLAGTLGGGAGDGSADRVIVNATAGVDNITVTGSAAGVSVTGLAATVNIFHAEFANDRLDINTLDGADNVDSSGLGAGVIQLFVDPV